MYSTRLRVQRGHYWYLSRIPDRYSCDGRLTEPEGSGGVGGQRKNQKLGTGSIQPQRLCSAAVGGSVSGDDSDELFNVQARGKTIRIE